MEPASLGTLVRFISAVPRRELPEYVSMFVRNRWEQHFCPVLSHPATLHSSVLFLYGHTQGMWKFPGQGLNPSHSCDLNHRCGTATPPTHCAALGIESVLPLR